MTTWDSGLLLRTTDKSNNARHEHEVLDKDHGGSRNVAEQINGGGKKGKEGNRRWNRYF